MGLHSKDDIKRKIEEQLNANVVSIEDLSDGCGDKFSVTIVSEEFKGKPLLQRHRMVNEALKEEMKTIHAFSQITLTPEQWEKKNSSPLA